MPRAFLQGLKSIDGAGLTSELKLRPPKEKTRNLLEHRGGVYRYLGGFTD
jgi:hypothetical protein